VTKTVPFLRVADAEASAEWYARLGFTIDWRHRFAPNLPLFISISNGDGQLFLSEHTGDARPDTLVYVYVDDVDAVAVELGVAVQTAEYGMRELELVDPDGNRLRFGTPVAE
jgi:catechol 2,3-dioxygenase-like lactoylglutathione lyase family enzyme